MSEPLFVRDPSDDEREERVKSTNQEEITHEIPIVTLEDKPQLVEQTLAGSVDVNSTLSLKFQQMILEELLIQDSLLVLAKGLGLESIVANLLHVVSTPLSALRVPDRDFSNPKRSLVILLNAHEEENIKIGEELTELSWTDAFLDPLYSDSVDDGGYGSDDLANKNLKRQFTIIKGESVIVKKRKQLYEQGGIISISSRIFIVDLLSGIVDSDLITGLVMLHADKISETSNESFIINFYRSKNPWGFIKCVTDEPQSLINTAYSSSGGAVMNPLRLMLRNMQLDKCLLWPRFHINVISSLNFRGNQNASSNKKTKELGKVMEIKVSMTESMQRIQLAILSCLKALLYEIKRHNPEITAESQLFEDLNKGNTSNKVNTDISTEDEFSKFLDDYFLNQVMALFNRSWHRISWTTKLLISDLSMLKRLLNNLINYDCIEFYEDIELILHDYKKLAVGGRMNYNGSPWLMLDEASTVISFAKKRVYDIIPDPLAEIPGPGSNRSRSASYLLEELPKWEQLAILLQDIITERTDNYKLRNLGPILIMCSGAKTVAQLREFLAKMIDEMNSPNIQNIEDQLFSARRLMLRKFRDYSLWKNDSIKVNEKINQTIKNNEAQKKAQIEQLNGTIDSQDNFKDRANGNNDASSDNSTPSGTGNDDESNSDQKINVSKTFTRDAQPIGKRRRTRGGAYMAQATKLHTAKFSREDANEQLGKEIKEKIEKEVNGWMSNMGKSDDRANGKDAFAELVKDEDDYIRINDEGDDNLVENDTEAVEFVSNQEPSVFELVSRQDQIIIERYDQLTDEKILNELLPSYIVMYEPDLSFVRRVEVFQAENKSYELKTFLMYYGASIEEQRYLNRIKKEKESFTKLVREKGQLSKEFKDKNINTWVTKNQIISTRIAGGNKKFIDGTRIPNKKVVVDIREFRSALPNILFRAGFEIVPCVITVGDYILSPKICVERKSVPDLIGSFEKGNLFSQCTRMFRYYEIVILLIEFDENKSFALNPFTEFRNRFDSAMKSNVKDSIAAEKSHQDIRLKLSMLLLSFPKLKIIWSPSPYKTAEIFKELKIREDDPDIDTAITAGLNVGIDDSLNIDDSRNLIGEIQFNDSAIDVVKNIPGVTSANYHSLITHVRSMQELVSLEEFELALLVGEENARKIYNFVHQNIVPK